MHDPEAFVEGKAGFVAGLSAPGKVAINQVLESLDWSRAGPKPRILDYGCGPGRVTLKFIAPYVEKWDGHVVGVDVSSEMVTYAKEKSAHPSVEYHQANYFDYDSGEPVPEFLAPGSYDIVICNHVLHYLKPHKPALARLAELLKPGGQLGFVNLTKSIHYSLLTELAKEPKFKPFMEKFEYKKYIPQWIERNVDFEQDLTESASGLGIQPLPSWLKLVSVETWRNTVDISLDSMAKLMYSVGPLSGRLPTRELEEDVKEWYRQQLRKHYEVVEEGNILVVKVKGHRSETVFGVFQKNP